MVVRDTEFTENMGCGIPKKIRTKLKTNLPAEQDLVDL